MKLCCEYIIGIKYKLRMMVILSERPYCIYGDKKSVLCNTSIPN